MSTLHCISSNEKMVFLKDLNSVDSATGPTLRNNRFKLLIALFWNQMKCMDGMEVLIVRRHEKKRTSQKFQQLCGLFYHYNINNEYLLTART